jgi:uncharacterized protein YndB with AHSA1/START domain
MAQYCFLTEWRLEAPVERVWDVLLDVRRWPAWWKGFRSAEVLESGDDRGVGMTVRQRWQSVIPYTVTLDLDILAVRRHHSLTGHATGDLEGICTWTFSERDGCTVVRFEMDVRPTRWWMDLPIPFKRRVMAANYGAIMRAGELGLSQILGSTAPLGATTAALSADGSPA